ncbi:hypothetical protein AVEN_115429-1, partial [Araneus ventricosus]
FPKIEPVISKDKYYEFQNVNITASQLPENLTAEIQSLEYLRDQGILSRKGYLRKKSEMIAAFILASNGTADVLVSESDHHSLEVEERQELKSSTPADLHLLKKSQLLENMNVNIKSDNQSNIPSSAEEKKVWENMKKFVNPAIWKNLDKLSVGDPQSLPKGPEARSSGPLQDYFKKLKSSSKVSLEAIHLFHRNARALYAGLTKVWCPGLKKLLKCIFDACFIGEPFPSKRWS